MSRATRPSTLSPRTPRLDESWPELQLLRGRHCDGFAWRNGAFGDLCRIVAEKTFWLCRRGNYQSLAGPDRITADRVGQWTGDCKPRSSPNRTLTRVAFRFGFRLG